MSLLNLKTYRFFVLLIVCLTFAMVVAIYVKFNAQYPTRNLENYDIKSNLSGYSLKSLLLQNNIKFTGNVSSLKVGNYNFYVFNSSGSITFLKPQTINYILVGGGGAGGTTGGYPGSGGGGGGGITFNNPSNPLPVLNSTYSITVGSGGTSTSTNGGSSSICLNASSNCIVSVSGGSVGSLPVNAAVGLYTSGYGGTGGSAGTGGGVGGTGGFYNAQQRDRNWNRLSTVSASPTSINFYGCTGNIPTSSITSLLNSLGLNLSIGNGGGGGGSINNGGGNGGGFANTFNAGPQSLSEVGSGGGGGGGGYGGGTGGSGYYFTPSKTGGNGGYGGSGGYNPIPITGPYTGTYSYGNGGGGSGGVFKATGYNGGTGSNGVVIIYF